MADTTTAVLGLVKPEVGASTDTWGPKYHSALDAIDLLFTDPAKKMLKLANGGTGADTAAGARTNLGLGALAVLATVGTAQITDGSVTAVKLAAGVTFPSGTRMTFQQTTAPTGWTKDTTHNDKAFRVVSGSVVNGGTAGFTTAFASRTPAGTIANTTAGGTVGNTTLTIAQMPLHGHPFQLSTTAQGSMASNTSGGLPMTTLGAGPFSPYTGGVSSTQGQQIGGEGGGGSHTHTFTGSAHNHTFTGTAMDFAVAYVDLIIAQKD